MNKGKENLTFLIVATIIMVFFFVIVLCGCKKAPVNPVKNYTITFKVTGTGNYHYQKRGITAQGHVIGSQSFVVGAITGDGIELDAVNDTVTKSISIEIDGSGNQSNYSKSGPGQQQINFTLN